MGRLTPTRALAAIALCLLVAALELACRSSGAPIDAAGPDATLDATLPFPPRPMAAAIPQPQCGAQGVVTATNGQFDLSCVGGDAGYLLGWYDAGGVTLLGPVLAPQSGVGFDASATGNCVVGGDGGGTVGCETTIPVSVLPSGIPLSALAVSSSGYCAVLSDGGAAGGYCGTVPASAMSPTTLTRDVVCTSAGGYCDASVVSATGSGTTTDNGATGATFAVNAVAAKLAAGSTRFAEQTTSPTTLNAVGSWITVYGPAYVVDGGALHCVSWHDGYDMSGLSDGGLAVDGGGTATGTIRAPNEFHGTTEFTYESINAVQSMTPGGGTPYRVTDGGMTIPFVPSQSCIGYTSVAGDAGSCGTAFAPLAQGLLTDGGFVLQFELPSATVISQPWSVTTTSNCTGGP